MELFNRLRLSEIYIYSEITTQWFERFVRRHRPAKADESSAV